MPGADLRSGFKRFAVLLRLQEKTGLKCDAEILDKLFHHPKLFLQRRPFALPAEAAGAAGAPPASHCARRRGAFRVMSRAKTLVVADTIMRYLEAQGACVGRGLPCASRRRGGGQASLRRSVVAYYYRVQYGLREGGWATLAWSSSMLGMFVFWLAGLMRFY